MRKLEGFVVNQSKAAEYAARGRVHGGLTVEELAEKWIAAFGAIVRAPGRADLRIKERDLSAEFRLRNIEPPYQHVQEDRERLIEEISEQLEVLRTSLPYDFQLLQAGTLASQIADAPDRPLAKPTAVDLQQRISKMVLRDKSAYRASSRRDH